MRSGRFSKLYWKVLNKSNASVRAEFRVHAAASRKMASKAEKNRENINKPCLTLFSLFGIWPEMCKLQAAALRRYGRVTRRIFDIDQSHDHGYFWFVKTISKSRLKAQMLGVFRELEQRGGELVVTDHGRPTLKISVLEAPKKRVRELFADVAGKIVYHENIMTPTIGEWTEV